MTRILMRLALGASLTVLTLSSHASAGRGGGMQRGGGYGGSGMQREGGGGGGYGGGMSHSPSFSQPHSQTSGSANGNHNAGSAAAGAGYANHNQQPNHSNAGAAAAGAGYSNRNQQPNHPAAAPAAAGAGYANRNQQPNISNAGAAATGAGYANRNQSGNYSNAGAAAAGAAYANNNNGYNQYGGGSWNGNYGNGSMGSYGGMGMASPSYGYGSTPYTNPYAGSGANGGGQAQPTNNAPPGYDYSQPVSTAAAPTDSPQPADPNTTPAAQAHQAFQAGDYANAVQFTQQALGQTPNDVDLHQFLALGLFAQGNYEQAAAPLYAVLAVGPGWNWTTLIGNYSDASVYTTQLRSLEAYVRANPGSANAQFVEAYQYISQGHPDAAIVPLKVVVSLQPKDGVSIQLLDKLLPPTVSAALTPPLDPSLLPGVWVAQAPPNATITLTFSDDANFTWVYATPGKPSVTINGPYSLGNGVLTLSGKGTPGGPLAGQVGSTDDKHMTFKALGASPSDPALQFVR